jgi:THO complex subunit 2
MGPKRKRVNDSGSGRPSPHRPDNAPLGQNDRNRPGAGGRQTRRNERNDSFQNSTSPGAPASGSPLNSPTVPRPASASSQSAVAQLNTRMSSNLPSPTPSSPVHSGFHYEIVTDARLSSWSESGRTEVIDHGIQSRNDEDSQELSTIFQELVQSCLDFRLKSAEAGDIVKQIIGTRSENADTNPRIFDTHTLLLDTLAIYVDVGSGSYNANLRDFLAATGIDPALMRTILEPTLLEQLGLIRETFTKMGIRQATNILYKQANYNLLREETEGYAKLATELFTTSNTEPPTSEAIQNAFERVKGLIGTFDLDVGRVLDVTLDVFASVLIKQNRFFVKFLRISSWWPRSYIKSSDPLGGLPKWALPESAHWTISPEEQIVITEQRRQRDIRFWDRARDIHIDAFFELGGRRVGEAELQRLQAVLDANTDSDDAMSQLDPIAQWTMITKTFPPQGNRVAAQLLGFKLRFYESKTAGEEVVPANLFFMTALLIKIGFISLADLWPHLAPSDEEMNTSVKEKRLKTLEEEERAKTGRGRGALAMAGELPSEETPAPRPAKVVPETKVKPTTEAAKKGKPEYYQKYSLVTELLTLGALPDALFVLTRFPWLTEAFPDLNKLINRLISHSVQKVFEETRTTSSELRNDLEIPMKRMPDVDQGGVSKGSVRLIQSNPKRPLRWPHPAGEKDNTLYRCYWDDWADNIPVCQTVEDVITLCDTLMNFSGVNIGKDAALLAKVAAIGASSLANDQSPENMGRWQDLLKRLLVPALSMTEANSFAVQAVWDLLKLYPIAIRYNIYAEWFQGQTSRNSSIKSAFARTRSETNGILKRLSLENLSTMAKKLAKTAYASPGVVFKTAFDQIEAYPNLIEAFVECARYLTDLGYDVLTWSLMSALGGKARSRTQEKSVLLTSKWLQALSKFSGKVFKRYQHMKPLPVLQYVNNQLSKGNSTDLVILRELISTMAGVVPDVDFTDAQMRAMTGGEVLRRQTLISLGDRRDVSVHGAERLTQSLMDANLAGRLLVNLAQYRQSALYKLPDDESHVKYLATIMDEVHQALIQYLDFLRSNLSPDLFDANIPGIIELMVGYGLDVDLAFMIGRASLANRMANSKVATQPPAKDDNQPAQEGSDADGDLVMNGDVSVSAVGTDNPVKEEKGESEDKMALDENTSTAPSPPTAADTRKSDPIAEVLQPLVNTIQDMRPPETWQHLSPEFYVIFWSLSLGDLHVPQSNYEAEHERLNKEAEDVMKDRSDLTRQGMNKKSEKKKSLLALAKAIREEMTVHIERYHKTKLRLARQSKSWFSGTISEANLTSDALLEHCILPRLLVSSLDTEYCFRMLKFLHENQTPNFKLCAFYDRFFNANRLRAMIFSCTVREAEHLGRFIKCILEDLARWHADKSAYEKEAFGKTKRNLLGFATAVDDEGNPTSFIEHPFFRDSHYEWHKNLNVALKACLQGTKEWMHIRNAFTVLKAVSSFFPAVNFMGTQLLKLLDEIKTREEVTKGSSEEGHRVDLAVTALTVYSMLKKRESKWVAVPAFRPNMVSAAAKVQVSARANFRQSGMLQDGPKDVEMKSDLRPTAAEFKPQQSAKSVVSMTTAQPVDRKSLTQTSTTSTLPADDEDGEVKDGKDSKAAAAGSNDNQPRAERPAAAQDRDAHRESSSKEKTSVPASRPGTPKSNIVVPSPTPPVAGGGRNESSRTATAAPRGDRVPHGLPSRPEVPIPPHYRPELFPQGHGQDRRDPARETREPRETRDQKEPLRETRDPRDRFREQLRDQRDHSRDGRDSKENRQPESGRVGRDQETDRRTNERMSHDPTRLSERDWSSRPDPSPRRGEPIRGETSRGEPVRAEPVRGEPVRGGPVRGEPMAIDREARTSRDRAPTTSSRDSRGTREHAVVSLPAHSAAGQTPPAEPPINPERAALLQNDDRTEMINPQRAVLLQTQQPHSSTRSPRDSGRDRASSRTQSPRRDDRYNATTSEGHTREDRHARRNGHMGDSTQLSARDIEQSREQDRQPNERSRDNSFHGPPRPHESDRGRPAQQDPNYGRLNPIPTMTEAPQGPRGRGARNSSRMSSMPSGPRSDGRMPPPDTNRVPSPDRQPPTGPSSSRPRRGPSNQFDYATNPSTGPSLPAGGMHPDRAHQFEQPMHPDRMRHVPPPPPPPPPREPSHSRPQVPPIHTSDRAATPTGPLASRPGQNSHPNTPITEQNPPQSAPTGPSGNKDRQRDSIRRQLGKLQDNITPGNKRDGDVRRPRQSMPDSDAQILTGASPVSTQFQERPDPTRRNVTHDRPAPGIDASSLPLRDSRSDAHEEFLGSRGEHERSGRREHRERPDRPSRHSGRERSPRGDREAKDTRGSEQVERHDRRSGIPPGIDNNRIRDPNHEPIQPRRPGREPTSTSNNRDSLPGAGREPSGSGREPRYRGDGRGDGGSGGRPGEDWGGGGRGGSMRGGPRDGPRDGPGRLGDDRRDPRGDERSSGRKRRSDISEMPPNDRDKRPRR